MGRTTANSYFWQGARDSIPFVFVAGPFGILFGVLATEAGLQIVETMVFTVTVFAGAAQFTALQLLQELAPTIVIVVSALAVNLRCAMYSASLTPYLGAAPMWQRAIAAFFIVDQSYALSITRFETERGMTLSQRMRYFSGTNALIAPTWLLATAFGAVAGTQIPDSWALDFALPIAFLAMIMPMLRTLPHVVAALVATGVAILAAGLPYNLALIVAGILGMMAGAWAETVLERRRQTT